MHRYIRMTLTLAAAALLVPVCHAQKVVYKPRGETTAKPGDYSVSYGHTTRTPANFKYYYNQRVYAPAAAPAPPAKAAPTHVTIGYVKPYTDDEYAQMVIRELNEERASRGERLIGEKVESTASVDAKPAPKPAPPVPDQAPEGSVALQSATVTKVLDSGILVAGDAGELRLRGLALPLLRSKHEVRRKFAEQAMQLLGDLLLNRQVYYTVQEPSKSQDGRLLAIVHLDDGTEINRLLLESGLAIVNPSDFVNEEMADEMLEAEHRARQEKRGIWEIW